MSPRMASTAKRNAAPVAAVDETRGSGALQPRDLSSGELGRRIKMLRVSRGLTLKDLEERGGISATHVSEIERGKASPTVGALGRIARALGLRPATLVEPHVLPAVSVLRASRRIEHRVVWNAAILEPLTEPADGSDAGGQLIWLPVTRDAVMSHRHEGEEWITVLSGVAEIRVEAAKFVLREGDSLHFRAHREHAYLNLAATPSLLLVAMRPRLTI
jgi:transcriptional regulator with XRE-family HTH domain